MALNFGDSFIKQPEEINNTGMQFIQSGATPIFVIHNHSTAGSEEIYTVTTGKKLYLTKIILCANTAASNAIIYINDGANKKFYEVAMSAGASKEIDFTIPVMLSAGYIISVDMKSSNNTSSIAGWEQ